MVTYFNDLDLDTFYENKLKNIAKKLILSSFVNPPPKMTKAKLIKYICEKKLYHQFAHLIVKSKISMRSALSNDGVNDNITFNLTSHEYYNQTLPHRWEKYNKVKINMNQLTIYVQTNGYQFSKHNKIYKYSDYQFDFPNMLAKDKVRLYKVLKHLYLDQMRVFKKELKKLFILDIGNIIMSYSFISIPI